MVKKIFIIIGLIALLLLLSPSLSSTVSAAGLIVYPTDLELSKALKGEVYEGLIAVSNPDEDTAIFSLFATGDAAGWISFYLLDDPETPVESITVPGGGEWAKILVKFSIPQDALSQEYTATIYVETTPTGEAGGEVGAEAQLQVAVPATIEVTGERIVTADIRNITTRNVEVGDLLRIKVEFVNTGNVWEKPQIAVAITKDTKDGAPIDSFTYSPSEIKVGAREIIEVVWDTTGRDVGDYVASVTVSLEGNVIATRNLPFKILPPGGETSPFNFQILWIGLGVGALIVSGALVYRRRNRRNKRKT